MIKTYINERIPFIEERLSELVPDTAIPHGILFEAARYSLLGGGKRIRPLLALATAESLGTDWKKALTAACAIELIHTYSMIHDDLPCMDDDDFRRGKPSLHKQYDEGIATLAGDFLLTHAFQVLAAEQDLEPLQKVKLIQALSENSGGHGMIAGQILDLAGQELSLVQLKNMHLRKTGKLIAASLEIGAIVASTSDDTQKQLKTFGEEIGLAFQIVDDILDITECEKKHGKKQSSDQINGKTTYVTLLGIEGAKKAAQEHLSASLAILKNLKLENSLLSQFAELLVMRKI